MHSLKLFLIILPLFLLMDFLWLGVLMSNFYSQELGDLARRDGSSLSPRWGAAILVYLLIPGGIVLFVKPQLGHESTLLSAFAWGALFGLVVYGVYDLTNLAVLEKWTLRMTLIDLLWGSFISGLTAVVMCLADRWLRQ